jgi:LPXTG-site transpeptidase (sortase) family protein
MVKRRKSGNRGKKRSSLNLILLGILFVCLFFLRQQYKARSLSFFANNSSQFSTSVKNGYKPVRIMIDAYHVNLEVKEASIKDGIWQVWDGAANHLDSSANPGGGGNIVIYGHNKNSVFGPIRWLSTGEVIKLTDEEGTEFLYKVEKTVETSPDDVNYVLPKNTEILTLYTCTSLFDSKRFIVIAKLQK